MTTRMPRHQQQPRHARETTAGRLDSISPWTTTLPKFLTGYGTRNYLLTEDIPLFRLQKLLYTGLNFTFRCLLYGRTTMKVVRVSDVGYDGTYLSTLRLVMT